jgi:hypothetical protein
VAARAQVVRRCGLAGGKAGAGRYDRMPVP